ncbi:MAG: response regulator [Candidatus Latescibacterota bacterium]|jgi:DNA-binding NarL/FixJ family response regulator
MENRAEAEPREGRYVLIVDDSNMVRHTVSSLLKGMGFRVVEAADGTQVKRLVETYRPVLVILDLSMPEKGGVAVLTELRADRRSRELPVIVLTGAADQRTVRQVARLKANGYLLKENLTVGKMRERIRAVLGAEAVSAPIPAAPASASEVTRAAGEPSRPTAASEGAGDRMVNRTELLERVDQDLELLQHLVDLFLRDSPALVEGMRQAIAAADPEALQRAGHTLKGMLGNLGVRALAETAGRLEAAGQQQRFTEAAAMLAELEQALPSLEHELRQIT